MLQRAHMSLVATAIPHVLPSWNNITNLIHIPTDGMVYNYAQFKDDTLLKTFHLTKECTLLQEIHAKSMINGGIRKFTGYDVRGDIYLLLEEEGDANQLVSELRLARANQLQHAWLKTNMQRILSRM